MEIIGIDHGFGNMKTQNTIFKTGIRCYDTEPVLANDILKYQEKYYVIGDEHKSFVADKVADEDYRILTIAALAKEMRYRQITSADVILAVGLPLQWVTSQKESFRQYLLQDSNPEFSYKGRLYNVRIRDVIVYPQGFAGVVQSLNDFDGINMLSDIGNGTMNTMFIKDRKPLSNRFFTDKLGVEQCIIRMRNDALTVCAYNGPDSIFEDYLRNGGSGMSLPESLSSVLKRDAEEYAVQIMTRLREYEYNPDVMHLVVIGGGGCILRNFLPKGKENIRFITDLCAAAKGFEIMALNDLRRGKRRVA